MRTIFALLFILLTCSACISQQETHTKCGSVMCTDEFISIPVKLISTKSNEIDFKSYKVIDLATGKEVKSKNPPTPNNANTVIITDDSRRRDFPEKGTDLQLQVTRKDDRVVKADYKISGGHCACHVSKLSGPDQVDLDQ